MRYFSFPVIDKAEWKVRQYRETIDSCQVIICYYDPAKNSSADNLFFNYAREQKKRIVNLFQGESHYLHGQPLEELEQMIHKWIELLKNG